MKIESSKPRKQRKHFFERALNEKRNSLAGHLRRELRKKMGKRGLSLRKGDTVKVLRGKNRGKEGKITGVNYKKGIVFIEKITRKKSDGTEIPVGVPASKVLVLDIAADERRLAKNRKEKSKVAKKEGE
ncbi:MAG: 50S ribosomal protein L24 [Candidatus ainarchaeum sp.]|nr:50S ribosomal protein L24 [Candidatus ainarchaeum sp.]